MRKERTGAPEERLRSWGPLLFEGCNGRRLSLITVDRGGDADLGDLERYVRTRGLRHADRDELDDFVRRFPHIAALHADLYALGGTRRFRIPLTARRWLTLLPCARRGRSACRAAARAFRPGAAFLVAT